MIRNLSHQISSTRKSKRVSFALDTKDTHGRTPREYDRQDASRYSPGVYASSETAEWQDTSFMMDIYYNFSQLKVFVGTLDEVVAIALTYDSPEEHEGTVHDHPRLDEITEKLAIHYHNDEPSLLNQLKDCDWVLLSLDDENGEIQEVLLHQTWDIEDDGYLDASSEVSDPSIDPQ
ncbi:hypothetical protein GQ44DRAFT_731892 [Phaeosphaeriaceae sp. PMI808]|nr:hypothetical protein GQ44DRAFT_731892 [Phaeosphaeriaceae sp. PMI808]